MHTTPKNQILVWSLAALALLLNLAGYLLNLFEKIHWYDDVVHAYTSFAWTLLLALFLYDAVLKGVEVHPILYVLTVAGLGIGLGAVWEIIEWSYDQMVAGNVILGKTDTILDLILDLLGATLAGILSARMIREK
jgi:hypothetical protein